MNWSQLRTIIWLRWRLTRNQWSRGGQLNAVLTIIVSMLGLALGFAGGIAGLLGGAFALAKASPPVMLIVWDLIVGVFLFLWLAGIVSEIQRSETIDISRMLHLPISLRNIFIVNYLASHLTFSIILFLPAIPGRQRIHDSDVSAGAQRRLYDYGVELLPARVAGYIDDE